MVLDRKALLSYFIFGTPDTKYDPVWLLEQAIEGGITAYQFREKGPGALTGEERLALARRLRAVARRHGVLFFVDDDPDLALEVEADGVHIGQEDEPIERVRQRVGTKLLIGVSTTTLEQAKRAEAAGADYIGAGPIFPTQTKPGKPPVGPEHVARLREAGIALPIVAIGGITPENAEGVMRHGADGVAYISAVARADEPKKAARAITRAAEAGLGPRGG
ncbi:thiamine phosphate synthase [Hydrogenibacillus sp. N12]|nr:thiamine phosphate synthase [Hydrogenibacillus sp. N12]